MVSGIENFLYIIFLTSNVQILGLNQGSAFGSGGPETDRAERGFRVSSIGLGLDVNGLTGLGLKVCGLTLTKISGLAKIIPSASLARFALKVREPGRAARLPTLV